MELLKNKIPKHLFERLELCKIDTLEYFLITSKQEICDKTKLSTRDVTTLINIVSEINLNNNFTTALTLKNQNTWSVLYTGCPKIDEALQGISTRGITEIYGESGTGKTQFCLHLLVQFQTRSINEATGAVYISTEGNFPSKRLQELLEVVPIENRKKITDSIYLEHIQDTEGLKHCIGIKIPVLLSKVKIKLIIIDSIAAVFRYDNETNDYILRSEDLRFLSIKLNKLSITNNIAIICINQVTEDPNLGIKPCLGLSWSNLIRTRIKLSRCKQNTILNKQEYKLRKIKIIFSPDVFCNECLFVITKTGLIGIA